MAVNPESDDTMMANIFVTRQIPAAGLKPLPDIAKVVVSPLDRELTPQELIEQTRGVFNYQVFSRMKPEAFFINTARGPIHNESELVQALDERLIAGAGLDVYEREPEAHPGLLDKQNVVLAPHLGTATREVRTQMALMVAENVIAFLEGREPPNRVA